MQLSDFVFVKDRVFTPEFCNELIDLFEKRDDLVSVGEMAGGVNTEVKNTTDLNLFMYDDLMDQYGNFILSKFNELTNEYVESLPYQNKFSGSQVFASSSEYTTCQLQKYVKNEGHYNAYHFETDHPDNCCRAFVYIFYLNDVLEGGETDMLYANTKVQPKQGRVVVHPAAFPFIHNGHMPVSHDKYILTSWLNYV
jgi:hypothetical protein|tara:strand:+ start:3736 stop:4323 length:588 start_codon:yes stop_codon:yes gene_type:complete